MMAWIVVALLAVFSANAGVPSTDADASAPEAQSLDGAPMPPKP
jgi:hypothetical protein